MNTQDPRDRELSDLLKSWQVETRDDPALARKVWRRIEAPPPPSAWRAWLESLTRLLAQPAAAVAALALFAAVGALTAEVASTARREARLDRLATEYAQSIDPILMSGHGDSSHRP